MGSQAAQELLGWVSEALRASVSKCRWCALPLLWLWILSRLSAHQGWVLIDSAWASCRPGQVWTSKRDGSISLCSQKCGVLSEMQVKYALSHLRQSRLMKYPSVTEALLYLRLRLQARYLRSLVNYRLYLQFVACVYPQYVCSRTGNLIHIDVSDYHIYYYCLATCFC